MVEYMKNLINQLPIPLQSKIAVYIDDIVITSATFSQHLADLEEFFKLYEKQKNQPETIKVQIFIRLALRISWVQMQQRLQ